MTDTHIKINAVTPRVQYTGNGVTTVFPYEFAIFDDSDMVVYFDGEVQESGYTVSGTGQTEGGNVTFDTAPADGVVITLYRNIPIERITDFQEGGTFRPKNLNDEFDKQTAFLQQVSEALSRAVKVDVTSDINPEEILPEIERLYDSADNIDTVAQNISSVADVSMNMSDINDCADNMAAIQDAPTQASNAAGSASDAAASAEQAAQSAALSNPPPLFLYNWYEYKINDIRYLRADTFSWQSGGVYKSVYDHLVADMEDLTSQTETVGSYTITYYEAEDGHKIVMPNQETTVLNIYNESGIAWYYILDTTNQRFKLPRENPAREELIQVVRAKGNGNGLGLTNGTNSATLCRSGSYGLEGGSVNDLPKTLGQSVTTGWPNYDNVAIGIETDSTKSGIISDMTESTSVYKGRKYLYCYVGNYTRSATEQTAGLNAELFNDKVDLNLSNMNPSATAKQTIVGWGMPDYANASDITSTKIAPKNGICEFHGGCNSGSYFELSVNNHFVGRTCGTQATGATASLMFAVAKDDVISWTSPTGANSEVLNFYPFKGV